MPKHRRVIDADYYEDDERSSGPNRSHRHARRPGSSRNDSEINTSSNANNLGLDLGNIDINQIAGLLQNVDMNQLSSMLSGLKGPTEIKNSEEQNAPEGLGDLGGVLNNLGGIDGLSGILNGAGGMGALSGILNGAGGIGALSGLLSGAGGVGGLGGILNGVGGLGGILNSLGGIGGLAGILGGLTGLGKNSQGGEGLDRSNAIPYTGDRRVDLLYAIRPMVTPDRANLIDMIVQLYSISKILRR